jgi:transcriptional regulator with XRE-family HTH domain
MRGAHRSHASGGHLCPSLVPTVCRITDFPRVTEGEISSCAGSVCRTASDSLWQLVGRLSAVDPCDASGKSEMRDEDLLRIQRQAIKDYRLALGLELKARRTAANLGFAELSQRARIPAETLRSYEKGTLQPQLVRLAEIGNVYGVSAFDILASAAEYIYRANGELIPDSAADRVDRIALRAVILYCGVTPEQLRLIESTPMAKPANGRGWDVNQ